MTKTKTMAKTQAKTKTRTMAKTMAMAKEKIIPQEFAVVNVGGGVGEGSLEARMPR